MGNIADLRVDLDAEVEGRWVIWSQGIRFKLRRSSYPPYQAARRKLLQDMAASYDPETSEPAAIATGKIIAEHLIVDWDGMQAPGGKIPQKGVREPKGKVQDVPCSLENRINLMTNPEYKDLVVALIRAASNPDNFIYEKARADGEKSETA